MAQRVVFSDASPLIGLSLVDGLGWLESLFSVVCITNVVADELLPGSNKPGEAGIAAAIAEGSTRIVEDVWTESAFPTLDEAAVGWVEQSETHHPAAGVVMGFGYCLYPSYAG